MGEALPPRPDEPGSAKPPWFLLPALVIGVLGAVVLIVAMVWLVLAWAAFE